MSRVKMTDVIRATGLSRATVDRALNGRGGLHPETERRVRDVFQELQHKAAQPGGIHGQGSSSWKPGDMVLRMGRGLTEQMFAVQAQHDLPLKIYDMHERGEKRTLEAITELCADVSRPLILTVRNDQPVVEELKRARKRGKRIIALVSDLDPDARDVYVGIDNRNAGRAAALLVGNTFRQGSAKVGVILGNYAFRCHEDREIGFRSYLRSAFPNIAVTDAAKGEDSIEQTRNAVLELIKHHPDIGALYNVAGGNAGLASALDEAGLAGKLFVITHETNAITIPLMRRGLINLLIAQSPFALMETAFEASQRAEAPEAHGHHAIDFSVITPFNIPLVDPADGTEATSRAA